MNTFYQNLNLNVLISAYFSDPQRRLTLNSGDYLLRKGEPNHRLYLVLKGALSGYVETPGERPIFLFRLENGMFAGVYSFFSKTYISSTTIIADELSEVAYIDSSQKAITIEKNDSLFEQFMPVVAADLAHRQQLMQQISFEKEQALKKLIHTEKMASLGQMAAGISHELNNSVAVLKRGAAWLSDNLADMLKNTTEKRFFDAGNERGRSLSTREVRRKKNDLLRRFAITEEAAEYLAETGVPDDLLPETAGEMNASAERLHHYWELGATLNGMRMAAAHASHVARSVKTLGAPHSIRRAGEDVNESLREALALLYSPLRKIQVKTRLGDLPPITANRGELVQIWVNMLKNACESLLNAGTDKPEIEISSRLDGNSIQVKITDNGPGIPAGIQESIFQPNFTTKVEGLSFGLGLGLTIVQRLVHSYGGKISVKSKPGKTTFYVTMPVH